MAQAMTEDCSPPQRLTRSATHSHGGLSPSPPFRRGKGGMSRRGCAPSPPLEYGNPPAALALTGLGIPAPVQSYRVLFQIL